MFVNCVARTSVQPVLEDPAETVPDNAAVDGGQPQGSLVSDAERMGLKKRDDRITEKDMVRLNSAKQQWAVFERDWVERHGSEGQIDLDRDAVRKPPGKTWSNAPVNKHPFRVLHYATPPPRPPR